MELTAALRLVDQACGALSLAHQYGVVHCDIKPENILLDESGNAYLGDFGIAQIMNDVRDSAIDFISSVGSPAIVHTLLNGLSYEAYHPQAELIDEALVAQAHASGKVINGWTVNDLARARLLRDLGVDGIITDVPDQMLTAVRGG